MRGSQRGMGQPVMSHEQEHSGCSRDAGERSREQTHQSPNVDQGSEHGKSTDFCEHTHGSRAGSEVLSDAAKSKQLGVRSKGKEGTRENCTLNDCARDCLERLARL